MMEQDVIGHLIDIERLAYDLLIDAENEVNRRKAQAKEESERDFRLEYDTIVSNLEANLVKAKSEIDEQRNSQFTAYTSSLRTIPQDRQAFYSYLDTVVNG